MEAPTRMWVVKPRYPLLRRVFFPVYGADQAIFFTALILVVAVIAAFNSQLALYLGIGGYVGAMFVMEVTTPSSVLLPADYEERVVQLFDEAPFLRRTGERREWISSRGRLYRWESDTLQLTSVTEGVLVTGGHRDLQILVEEIRT